jgi:23S rRNA (pseudouridine1915-N3)-methyltransferase
VRIAVHAVGRMKAGAERELAERYFERFARSAPALGLEWDGVSETAEGRARDPDGRRREERMGLEAALRPGGAMFLLDERGRDLTSVDFAKRVETLRDAGHRDLLLAIGGPDGHDPALRGRAGLVLAFGAATWPHQLVRVMLAEQLYRAATILGGHPYHRA